MVIQEQLHNLSGLLPHNVYAQYQEACHAGDKIKAIRVLYAYIVNDSEDKPEPELCLLLLSLFAEVGQTRPYVDCFRYIVQKNVLSQEEIGECIQNGLTLKGDISALYQLAEEYLSEELRQFYLKTELKQLQTTQFMSLVRGGQPLKTLTDEETEAVSAFLPLTKQYQIFRNGKSRKRAILQLERHFKSTKRPLTPLINLLCLLYEEKNSEQYARYLWVISTMLGSEGKVLIQHLLENGKKLDKHALYSELSVFDELPVLKELGVKYNYIPSTEQKLSLVNRVIDRQVSASLTPLEEAENRLIDGQVDQAVIILENAILYNPEQLELYPALFEIYEKSEDVKQLEDFSRRLRTSYQQLPSEVTLMISQLHQRIHSKVVN